MAGRYPIAWLVGLVVCALAPGAYSSGEADGMSAYAPYTMPQSGYGYGVPGGTNSTASTLAQRYYNAPPVYDQQPSAYIPPEQRQPSYPLQVNAPPAGVPYTYIQQPAPGYAPQYMQQPQAMGQAPGGGFVAGGPPGATMVTDGMPEQLKLIAKYNKSYGNPKEIPSQSQQYRATPPIQNSAAYPPIMPNYSQAYQVPGSPTPLQYSGAPNMPMGEAPYRPRAYASDSYGSRWKVGLGGGAIYTPKFEGSSDYRVYPIPAVDVSYSDTFFVQTYRGAGINLFRTNIIKAGPFSNIHFGRDQKDASYLAGMGSVDPTIESGIFLEASLDPYKIYWEASYDSLGRGHDGITSELTFARDFRFYPAWNVEVGAKTSWASPQYMESMFGVSATQSSDSGLSQYTASSGVKDIGLTASAAYDINRKLKLSLDSEFTKLLGDAADSPIVIRGSDTQFFMGSTVIYTF